MNVKAEFKQVTPSEFQAHLEGKGFPPNLAEATAELCQVMTLEERYIEGEGILRGTEVSRLSFVSVKNNISLTIIVAWPASAN